MHEQRHVQSWHNYARVLQGVVTKMEDEHCRGWCPKANCEVEAAWIVKFGKQQLEEFGQRERIHANPDSPGPYSDYPPIGQMPLGT